MNSDRSFLEAALVGYQAQHIEIEQAKEEIRGIQGHKHVSGAARSTASKRKISAAGRRRIAAAQKKRWAQYKQEKALAGKD